MADAGREQVGVLVLGAWDAFLAQAAEVDLGAPTRLPGSPRTSSRPWSGTGPPWWCSATSPTGPDTWPTWPD